MCSVRISNFALCVLGVVSVSAVRKDAFLNPTDRSVFSMFFAYVSRFYYVSHCAIFHQRLIVLQWEEKEKEGDCSSQSLCFDIQ